MGFFICRVMRNYSMTWQQVMDLDFKLFWLLNRQIGRLQAEEDKRHLNIAMSAQSGEAAKEIQRNLGEELGQIVIHKAVFDNEGWDKLKSSTMKKKVAPSV